MPFQVDFKDVQIAGQSKTWCVVLPTCGARELIAHLGTVGLRLNCDGGARNPDQVQCDEWEDDACSGRILRGGNRLIGRFRVTHITQAQAQALAGNLTPPSGSLLEPEAAAADDVDDLPGAAQLAAAPEAVDWMQRCKQLGLRRGFK